jgi:hypothetical protein
MTSRLSLVVGVACAIFLFAVILRVGDRDPAVTVALVTLTALTLAVTYWFSRQRPKPQDEEVRKEIAELRQRLSALEGKVDGILALLSPGRESRLPPRSAYE